MTQIGTFWEGIILIGIGILMAVITAMLKVDFANNSTLLITLGVGYIGGGAAGKVEQQNAPTPPKGP